MKIYLKFDHSQKDSLKAIGCEYDGKEVNDRVRTLIQKYNNDDSVGKSSELAELMHKELDYEEILFLAMKSVEDKMIRMAIQDMKQKFRDLLD